MSCYLGLLARFHSGLPFRDCCSSPYLDFISFSLLFSFLIFLKNILEQLPQQSSWEETFTLVFLKMFTLAFLKMFLFILYLITGSFTGTIWFYIGPSFLQVLLFSVIWFLHLWGHMLISFSSLILESFPHSPFHFCCCDKILCQKAT